MASTSGSEFEEAYISDEDVDMVDVSFTVRIVVTVLVSIRDLTEANFFPLWALFRCQSRTYLRGPRLSQKAPARRPTPHWQTFLRPIRPRSM